MIVDVWSDVVCPWCYIGKRNLEAAIAQLGEPVEVRWHSFELDPRSPKQIDHSLTELLARKYGMSVARAEQMQAQVTQKAASVGLEFRFDRAKTGNTFDAHRLIHLAASQDLGGAMKERLLRAYFTDGEAISDHEALARLAGEVGVSGAAEALASDAYTEAVRADEREAMELGASGVPFFVVNEKFGVPGAQPAEVLLKVLRHAQAEAVAAAPAVEAGAACEDGVCEVTPQG